MILPFCLFPRRLTFSTLTQILRAANPLSKCMLSTCWTHRRTKSLHGCAFSHFRPPFSFCFHDFSPTPKNKRKQYTYRHDHSSNVQFRALLVVLGKILHPPRQEKLVVCLVQAQLSQSDEKRRNESLEPRSLRALQFLKLKYRRGRIVWEIRCVAVMAMVGGAQRA